MAQLTTKTFATLVKEQATAIQGSLNRLIDLSVGSIMRAIVESNAGLVLWLQSLILILLKTTRLSTSRDGDVDTWVGDFGLSRLPAQAATTTVTLGRVTTTVNSPRAVAKAVGDPSRFQTSSGSLKFFVTVNTADPNWSNADGGYVLGQGLPSIEVPVQCETIGAAGNVAIGAIDTIISSIPGIDTVTNDAQPDNGRDAESDAALQARFIDFIASLSKATKDAIGFAISSVQQGIDYQLTENKVYGSAGLAEDSAATSRGTFYVVIDDGTGAPTDALRDAVFAAVEKVRPWTVSTFSVFKAATVGVNVSCIVDAASGYIHSDLQITVNDAIIAYVDSLKIGDRLSFTGLADAIYNSSKGVKNVTGIQLNGNPSATDVTVTRKQVIVPGTVTVTVNA